VCGETHFIAHKKRCMQITAHKIEEANEQSISELIKEAENQFIELKEQFSEGVMKTISAFANTSGGVILIGVMMIKKLLE